MKSRVLSVIPDTLNAYVQIFDHQNASWSIALPQVQTDANRIIKLLQNYHNGEVPDDLAKRRFIRDIEKLPEIEVQLHLKGVLEAVCKNKQSSVSFFEEALKYSNDYNVCSNYWKALKTFGLTSESIKKGYELAKLCHGYEMQNELLNHSMMILDIENQKRIFDILKKANKLSKDADIENMLLEVECMEKFIEHTDLTEEELNQVGQIAYDLLAENEVEFVANEIKHKKQRPNLSVSYIIDSEKLSADKLFDLNFEFADRLIERNLHTIPVVAQFKRRLLNKKLESSEVSNVG
ncbi:hypothetical protein [Idiomarina xiamenensis]|uniref:Uncharacterized protein n=1 Tax=Idiomarina xiamenensis 10-D-4 TaxID=740709 RepID=K2KQF2_9GAMM|nr:hypothetical protein [Idiomarina xiamenensis]EKE79725.1 hypothetical protein A10D4_12734 [Idiomarina xiamenensis 10-D-4]